MTGLKRFNWIMRRKKYIAAYLKWNLKEKNLFNFPSLLLKQISGIKYGNVVGRRNHVLKIQKLSKTWPLWQTILMLQINMERLQFMRQHIMGILKLSKSFPLTDNPNAPNRWGVTPIHQAAYNRHTEIFQLLVPLTDNPLYWAAQRWHTETVTIMTVFCLFFILALGFFVIVFNIWQFLYAHFIILD